MIDIQVDPPAVRPCLHLRNSTLSSRSLRLWPLLTVKRRQKRRLREAGPGEGAQSPLSPVDPVQVAGLQEGREAAVLWEDATCASPVGEMFPADVPTENGTVWYFVLLVHAPEKRRLWAVVGEFCTKCKKKAWEKRFLWFLNAPHAVYIPSRFILTTCAVLSRDLSGENGPVCHARGGVATYAALEAWRWQRQSVFISVESQWQVAGGWGQVLFSPPLQSRHTAAAICPQKFTSRCYGNENGVCS